MMGMIKRAKFNRIIQLAAMLLVALNISACLDGCGSKRPTNSIEPARKQSIGGEMLGGLIKRFLYYPMKIERDKALPHYIEGAEEVFFKVENGNEMHALHWPAGEGRPTILFLHGNAQTVFEWALIRDELAPMDCGLFLIDYPGYGKSAGDPSEMSLYAAGYAAMKTMMEDKGIAESDIIVFAKSLGGGVATQITQDRKVKGLILESTFTSIPSVASALFPMLPTGLAFKSEIYDSASKLKNIHVPVLVVHGTIDEIIPFKEGERLFALANEPKEFYVVKGAGHNDVSMTVGDEYGQRLRTWLDGIEKLQAK
jgi:uncharacterized protein